MLSCTLVKQLISDWSRDKVQPFPYLVVGDHLKSCLSCLSWSTEIAFQPADRYVRALRLKLSDILSYLGSSLLAVWSQDQDVKISFCVEPESVPQARETALRFLKRYENFGPATRQEVQPVQEMLRHSDAGSPLAQLEPYELVRYFFATALQLAPDTRQRLSLLTNLGIAENYQALSERRVRHEEAARRHFAQAREYLKQVIAEDVRPYKGTSGASRESDKTALISARINLAGTEVQQGDYSEPALHAAIARLFEARRLVSEVGLAPADFTALYSNLLISYLELYLRYGLDEGLVQAEQLAREICAEPELGNAFIKECIKGRADPELADLLAKPELNRLFEYFTQQAGQAR